MTVVTEIRTAGARTGVLWQIPRWTDKRRVRVAISGSPRCFVVEEGRGTKDLHGDGGQFRRGARQCP